MKKIRMIYKPIVIITLVIITILSFYDFIDQTNNLNTDKVLNHLEDVGKQEANNFNQQFDNFKNIIISASNLIGNSFKSEEDIGNILENVRTEKNYFERLWYVDENKKLNNYKDHIVFETKNDFVNKIFNGESGITDIFTSSYNDKRIITIYAPVYRNNKIVGGVAGVFEINKVNKEFIYNDVFNDQAYVFTTNNNGEIITKIKNENTLYFGNDYFDFLENNVKYSIGNYNEIQKNIKNEGSGFLYYTYQNQNRLVYYTPIEVNNWYCFTAISADVIGEENTKMNKITAFLIIKIAIIVAALVTLLIRYFLKANKNKTLINEKLLASNRKIDMVLKQISDRIFEYDMINDSLTLDAWNDHPKILLNHFLSNLHNYNFVCREDEQLFRENFKIVGNDNQKVEFDAKLPYISKDYETWYHISMIYDEKSQHAIGTLKNSTKEMKEYLELLQDNMFKNSIYSHAVYMFAVNMKEKKVVIYQEEGFYHKVIDTNYDDYIHDYLKTYVHKGDKEEFKLFFDYDSAKSIYYDKKKNNKIEYRHYDNINKIYRWVRCRVQFERQSSNNELLMIVYSADIDDEKKKQLEIEFRAQRDGLTELYNRQTFNQLVDNYLDKKKSSSNYCAYMILDLDNFKRINDELGHSVGDKVLKNVSKMLEEVFEYNGYVGRFGGDEYVIFLYRQESYSVIEQKAMKVLKSIQNFQIQDDYIISASLGICFVGVEKNHQELFDKADIALYNVKNNGKNMFKIYYKGLEKK